MIDLVQLAENFRADNCATCKLGNVRLGPKSGCEVRKKLVLDLNPVAWKHIKLFVENGRCKMYKEAPSGKDV